MIISMVGSFTVSLISTVAGMPWPVLYAMTVLFLDGLIIRTYLWNKEKWWQLVVMVTAVNIGLLGLVYNYYAGGAESVMLDLKEFLTFRSRTIMVDMLALAVIFDALFKTFISLIFLRNPLVFFTMFIRFSSRLFNIDLMMILCFLYIMALGLPLIVFYWLRLLMQYLF